MGDCAVRQRQLRSSTDYFLIGMEARWLND